MRGLDWVSRHTYYKKQRFDICIAIDCVFSPDELLWGVNLQANPPDVIALPGRAHALRQLTLEHFGFSNRARTTRQLSLADCGFVRNVRARAA